MAMIIDPDLLADSATDDGSTEVYIDTTAKTIKLTKVGDLSDDGVTLKCLYSFLKEEWKDDPNTKNLAAFPFPMVPITDESFEFVDGWNFNADASRQLIRTAGWTVKNTSGAVTEKWAGIMGLGTIYNNDDQLYYQQEAGGSATNVVLTGQVNQAVQILSDPNGDGNYVDGYDRRSVFNIFSREYAQTYGKATLANIGVTTMDSIAYRFPLSSAQDLNITHDDTAVSTTSPYTDIKLRYFASAFSRDVDTTGAPRSFGIVIDVGTHSGVDGSVTGSVLTSAEGGIVGADYVGGTLTIHEGTNKGVYTISGTPTATEVTVVETFTGTESDLSFTLQRATPVQASKYQIYEKIQYLLRQNSDIDDSTGTAVIGKTADALLEFVGPDLKAGTFTPYNAEGGGSGVIVEGYKSSDVNFLYFTDNSAVARQYPRVVTVTINFGDNLKNDANAKYWVYFDDLPSTEFDFGTAGAIIVEDAVGADMAGNVGGVSSLEKSFNYAQNNQGGRTPNTPASIVAVGIGLQYGQYVRASTTITDQGATVSLVAPYERNYANPS